MKNEKNRANLRIGEHQLTRGVPTLIATAMRPVSPTVLQSAKTHGLDALELRLDQFPDQERGRCIEAVRAMGGSIPLLATIRSEQEQPGSGFQGTEQERVAFYRQIIPYVQAVDVEARAGIAPAVLAEAYGKRRFTVLSLHDFTATPPSPVLLEQIDTAAHVAVQSGIPTDFFAVKLVTMTNDLEDVRELAEVLMKRPYTNLIVFGMGARAMLTRTLFPALGSLASYGAWGYPAAPNQPGWEDLRMTLQGFFPEIT